jgi:hypothetical protein
MLYDTIESDLYGFDELGNISDPIIYLLNKEITQSNQSDAKQMAQSAVSSSKKLDREIKSKYNLFKQKEPQSGFGFVKPPGGFVKAPGGFANPPQTRFRFVR